jgi:hypothetical protein
MFPTDHTFRNARDDLAAQGAEEGENGLLAFGPRGDFRTICHFTDEAARAIAASMISDALKKQYKSGKRYGKIRRITIL